MGYKHDFVEDNPYLVYTEDDKIAYEPAEDSDDDQNDDNGDDNNG